MSKRRFSNFETYPKQGATSSHFYNAVQKYDNQHHEQHQHQHHNHNQNQNQHHNADYNSKSMPTSPRMFQWKRNSISTMESNESIYYLKERCLELELELEKIRNQMLQMKTSYQNKVVDMQRKMLEMEDEELESKKNSKMLQNGENVLIEQLKAELEEQKQLRIDDAKQVEVKAVQIKEWVLNKLKRLEDENRALIERNQQLEKFNGFQNEGDVNKKEITDEIEAVVESLKYLPSLINNNNGQSNISTHDYAEIYTPNLEDKSNWIQNRKTNSNLSTENSLSSNETTSETETAALNEANTSMIFLNQKPPTPPLHRCPSWERKIYQVANESISENCLSQLSLGELKRKNDLETCAQQSSGGLYCNINVPVYATVKGRASQIRSVPFTGDSSDDEDDDSSDYGVADHSMISSPIRNKISKASSFSGAHNCQLISDLSFESGISDDYAIPPDAFSCNSTISSVSGLISDASSIQRYSSAITSPQALRKQHSIPQMKPVPRNQGGAMFEKSGQLAKLGGKLKTWRKYWFVISPKTNSKLLYWKSQQDSQKKSSYGSIVIDAFSRINRTDNATFEIATDPKNYYFTAESAASMEDWVRVLQNIQRRSATTILLKNHEKNQPLIQGWVKKVKNGRIKHCWCVVIGKMLLYFKSNTSTVPLGQIDMRDAKVEEVVQSSDSDCDESPPIDGSPEACSESYTVGIFSVCEQGPTYLLFHNKPEYLDWLYHLTVVSGSGSSAGTQYEQLVQKLMESGGDSNSVLWKHPLLQYSKENIISPLTTLNSEALQNEAIKLFKCCQLFMSVAVDQAGIDYHVILAQNALQQCLEVPELQNELMCALIKQTSRPSQFNPNNLNHMSTNSGQKHSVQGPAANNNFSNNLSTATSSAANSNTNSMAGCLINSFDNQSLTLLPTTGHKVPTDFCFVQGWQLLALAVSLFVPRNSRILWYLKTHLTRNADNKTECGKYATYCNRALQRTLKNGERFMKPSRMEVLSLLLKNPFHHSLPHAIPVHMLNNSYQVIGFDGSTTVEEFLATLSQEIGCRQSYQNGFTLFSDDPIDKSIEHCLESDAKLCDVISKWETALREKGLGKFENSRIIKLIYKNRMYWKQSTIKMETDREKLLICYQTNLQIIQGRFPVNYDLALELASLMSQIDLGDYHIDGTKSKITMRSVLEKFYPHRYLEATSNEQSKDLEERLQKKWITLKGRSILDCVRIYLTCTRKWQFFGAALFQAYSKQLVNEKQTSYNCWIAVSEDCVSLLDINSMAVIIQYAYSSIVTFGGCQNDFMLVVDQVYEQSSSRKLLFSLSKPKILDLTLLIAEYMNAFKQTTLPSCNQQKRPKFIQDLYSNLVGHQPDILKSVLD